jgi:hypothetical protein
MRWSPRGGGWACLVRCGGLLAVGRTTRLILVERQFYYYYTHWKHQAFRMGVSGTVWGTPGCRWNYWTDIGRATEFYYYYYTHWKHQAFRVPCCEWVYCANDFRMGSSNSSFTAKSCAWASIAFLTQNISWSVDSMHSRTANLYNSELKMP